MSKLLTMEDFWMGRDTKYASQLTAEIKANGLETIARVNRFLIEFYGKNQDVPRRGVNSGWRPPAVNAATKGAATRSNHMLGKAVDVADPDGRIDAWASSKEGEKWLTEIGLWMEHKSATPRWAHFQIVPPRSGNRYFTLDGDP